MVKFTEAATSAIRDAIKNAEIDVQGLRLMVEPGGCSGNRYMMGLVDEVAPNDVVFEHEQIRVVVDPESAPLLEGVNIDFVTRDDGGGFTFNNPNATSRCSCGNSFSC
jgi:iron-sulfur cluster assembly protein